MCLGVPGYDVVFKRVCLRLSISLLVCLVLCSIKITGYGVMFGRRSITCDLDRTQHQSDEYIR